MKKIAAVLLGVFLLCILLTVPAGAIPPEEEREVAIRRLEVGESCVVQLSEGDVRWAISVARATNESYEINLSNASSFCFYMEGVSGPICFDMISRLRGALVFETVEDCLDGVEGFIEGITDTPSSMSEKDRET